MGTSRIPFCRLATISKVVVLVTLVMATGCANNLQVTYSSEPQGAALYEGDKFFGTTPVTLTYPVTEDDKKRGTKTLRGTMVRWVSGASASIAYLTADFQNGYRQTFHFRRPDGVAGYDVDANYALQLQRNTLMMMQTAAQLQAAQAQQQQAQQLHQLRQQQMLNSAPTTNIRCQSRRMGDSIWTDCQ